MFYTDYDGMFENRNFDYWLRNLEHDDGYLKKVREILSKVVESLLYKIRRDIQEKIYKSEYSSRISPRYDLSTKVKYDEPEKLEEEIDKYLQALVGMNLVDKFCVGKNGNYPFLVLDVTFKLKGFETQYRTHFNLANY